MAQIARAPIQAEAPLPEGWEEVHSRSRPGEISYQNMKTGRRTRVRPAEPADAAVSPAPTPAAAVALRTPSQTITTTAPSLARSAITTTASNPGDAPFIQGREFAPPRGPSPRKHELYFYIQILDLDVYTMQGTAFIAFYLKAAWCEPEIERVLDGEDGEDGERIKGMREKMDDFNHEADPTKWPAGLFDPKFDFKNSIGGRGAVTITQPKLEVSPWRTGPAKEPLVEYGFFCRGTFKQDFELEDFPFDAHPIRISRVRCL